MLNVAKVVPGQRAFLKFDLLKMGSYMKHFKSLRRQMNEHEDKMNALAAEQHEQQTIIGLLQEDVNAALEESKRLAHAIEHLSKESDRKSNSVLQRSQKSLAEHEARCHALAEAVQVMREEIKNQSAFMKDRELYFANLETTTRSALEAWDEYFKSSRPKKGTTVETLQTTCKDPDGAERNIGTKEGLPVVQAKPDHTGEEFSRVADVELHIKELTDQQRTAEETLKDLQLRYRETDMVIPTLQANLLTLQTEKAEEEEFIASLSERLIQLKGFDQRVICESCGYDYSILYVDSKFVLSETAEKLEDASTVPSQEEAPNVGNMWS